MKICLVHEEYPEETNFGGIATYQKTLAEELVKKGNEVCVICRGLNCDKEYYENGVKIYRIYVKKSDNQINDYIAYRKRVALKLKELQDLNMIDLIESPDWGAETIFFENNRKVPLVVRLHTPLKVWLKYNNNNFGKITKKMLKWEKKMLITADCVTCCSEALKKIIVNDFPINEEDIIVIPNPANITTFYYNKMIKKKNKILFVGSLEERKGILVLAEALNIVFAKYPKLKIDIIGKDTTRNKLNISTKEYILKIIKSKFHQNINFVGQISNNELNKYFNDSLVGIFPSLFDNFPYVVLESMSTGLHVIGSKNSGMPEMIENSKYIYNTGDSNDLAKKICEVYALSQNKPINLENMKKVEKKYNSSKICNEMLTIYENTQKKFYKENISFYDLNYVTNEILKENIIFFKPVNGGVANKVYKVETIKGSYIVKKYLYNYNFELANKLYNLYNKENINYIKPINDVPIYYRKYYFNLFEYKGNCKKKIDIDFLVKLAGSKRKYINAKNDSYNLSNKINKYYKYLKNNLDMCNKIQKKELNIILKEYEKIKSEKIFKETFYINHGDISLSNILCSNNKYYLIDFDEVCVSFELYDYAVIAIKNFTYNWNFKINKKEYYKYQNKFLKNHNYSKEDCNLAIKYYLCKILMEKYYFYQTNQIDLFDKIQKKDYYKKYLKLLQKMI